MFCYKNRCAEKVQDIKSLRCHLKIVHGEKHVGLFVCNFENCRSSFSQFDVFSRHLEQKHGMPKTSVQSPSIEMQVERDTDFVAMDTVSLSVSVEYYNHFPFFK